MLRTLRDMATGARQQLRDELGPEFADVDLRNLNPRTAVQRAVVATLTDRLVDRDLTEQRDAGAGQGGQRIGESLTAAAAEQLHARTVGHVQPAHVLDDADDLLMRLERDRAGPLGDFARGELRR